MLTGTVFFAFLPKVDLKKVILIVKWPIVFVTPQDISTMFLSIYIPFVLLFMKSSLLTPAPKYSQNCPSVFESYEGE